MTDSDLLFAGFLQRLMDGKCGLGSGKRQRDSRLEPLERRLIRIERSDTLLPELLRHASPRPAIPCQGWPSVRCTLTHGEDDV